MDLVVLMDIQLLGIFSATQTMIILKQQNGSKGMKHTSAYCVLHN